MPLFIGNPKASEHQRGAEGLFACCDTKAMRAPAGMATRWRTTHRPTTSPQMGTPAWDAWCAGELVWEPVLVLKAIRGKHEGQR